LLFGFVEIFGVKGEQVAGVVLRIARGGLG
jgi:hypothetical protein